MVGVWIALATLLAVLLASLITPVSLVVRVERSDSVRTSWRLRWLFGLVNVGAEGLSPRPQKAARVRGQPHRRGGPRRVLAVAQTPGFARRLIRLAQDLGRHVRCDHFSVRAEFGFDDPADTGLMYAMLTPLLVAASVRGVDVTCQPSFLRPCFEGTGSAALRARPLTVLWRLVSFLCSPPTLRAIRAAWRSKR
jgi:hypothetical protein